MTKNEQIRAIIWDYDCTLADTWYKNLTVSRKIIAKITEQDISHISGLRSLENYRLALSHTNDWRKFYMEECGLTKTQTEQAGQAWTDFQLRDTTPVQFFDGIPEVLHQLKRIPHGVVSLNSKWEISKSLAQDHLRDYFGCIVGYEDVGLDKQKPLPDALLLCIEILIGLVSGYVFYIGDHEIDAACVSNANQHLQDQGADLHVMSIGALYGCQYNIDTWKVKPDYHAYTPTDIIEIVKRWKQ